MFKGVQMKSSCFNIIILTIETKKKQLAVALPRKTGQHVNKTVTTDHVTPYINILRVTFNQPATDTMKN